MSSAPPRRFAVVALLMLACSATPALALGGKHPDGRPIGKVRPDWPDALLAAINSPGRVAGHWVNANDEFFYRGDAAAFAAFLGTVAQTKLPVTLVLHTTPQRRSLLWGEEPRVPYDWTLLVGMQRWTAPAWKLNFDDPGTTYALRVDVWLDDGGVAADEAIDLPAGVRLIVDRDQPARSSTQPAKR